MKYIMNTILDIRINSRFISPEMIYCFSFVVKRMFCYYVVKFKNKDILNLSKDGSVLISSGEVCEKVSIFVL